MLEAPVPKVKKQVKSFLGLIGYYRDYIPNFSDLAVPLTDLTRKGGEKQDEAFKKLKQILTQDPVLHMPDFGKPFIVQTDASDRGIGASLMQEHEGQKFPVAFGSKNLLERERAYSVIEKECLALVWAVRRFQKYLYGKEFILETDHQPLAYIDRTKMSNSRLMRWALFLQNYKFTIRSIKGRENVVADFLSRLY